MSVAEFENHILVQVFGFKQKHSLQINLLLRILSVKSKR